MNEMHTQPVKQLRRTRQGRIVAGVCSGVGEYVGIDPNILRVALAVATFFGGLGVGVYAVAWLLVPEQDKPTSILQDLIDKQRQQRDARRGTPGAWQPLDTDWEPPASPSYSAPS